LTALKWEEKIKFQGGGLILFSSARVAISAEKELSLSGYSVKLVAPPPELRKGCDLALEINLVEKPSIERLLNEKGIPYISLEPLKVGTAPLLDAVRVTDFGQWIMVKVGNMKITYKKDSGIIVNISGGGCPDIPYLHLELVNKAIDQAPRPNNIGFTLCALNLERALEECLSLLHGESKACF